METSFCASHRIASRTMPPKKKPRVTGPAEPENNGPAASNTPGSGESSAKPETDYDLVADPWTDEQETALLKAIIKWKPVGSCPMKLLCRCWRMDA